MKELFNTLMEALKTLNDNNNNGIIDHFEQLPSKEQIPEYFVLIKNPIDIATIRNKVEMNKYNTNEQMLSDFRTLTDNAMRYNIPKSTIYKNAKLIKNYINRNLSELIRASNENVKDSLNRSESNKSVSHNTSKPGRKRKQRYPSIETKDDLYKFLDNVIDCRHPDDQTRPLASPFYSLPKRNFYQNYYEIIKTPLSISIIRNKIKHTKITTFAELKSDLDIVFTNAMIYNDPSSTIYQDAKYLNDYVNNLDPGSEQYITLFTNKCFSKRRQSSNSINTTTNQNLTTSKLDNGVIDQCSTPKSNSQCKKSNLKMTTNYTHLDETICDNRELYSLLQPIYQKLRDLTEIDPNNPDNVIVLCYDYLLCPPPHKDPVYYNIVEHPIDISTIYKRLKHHKYISVEQFLGDFKLLFKNIQTITSKNDRLYKNVTKLEKYLLNEFGLKSLDHISYGCDKFSKFDPYILSNDRCLSVNSTNTRAIKSFFAFIKTVTDSCGKNIYSALNLDNNKEFIKIKHDTKYPNVYDAFTEINTFLDNICQKHNPNSTTYEDAVLLHYEIVRYTQPYFAARDKIQNPLSKLHQTIQEIWTQLLDHHDSTNHIYHYSLTIASYEQTINNNRNEPRKRIISFDLINFCVKNNIYQYFEIFQNDFVFLCTEIRKNSNIYSEPHQDAVKMLLHFVEVRDRSIIDLETNALNFSAALLSIQLETEPFSYPINQRDNIVNNYFVIDRSKLNLCNNYKSNMETQLTDDTFDEVVIKSQVYRKGDCVKIKRNDDDDWLILGFLENTHGKKLCVLGEMKNPEDLPTKYSRTNYPMEKIVTDNIMLHDVNKITYKRDIFYPLKFVNDNNEYKENPIFFDYFYSHHLDEYFYIDQLYINQTSVELTTLSTNIIAKEPHTIPYIRSVIREPTVILDGDNKFNIVELKQSLSISNTCNIEEITTGTTEEDGLTHYFQISYQNTFFRKDEYVYLYDDDDSLVVSKIVDIWKDENNNFMFRAMLFLTPDDINHLPTKMFYPNEIYKTNIETIQNIDCIYSHCYVLHRKYYLTERPVLYAENDVFVCERFYNEKINHLRRFKPFKCQFNSHPHIISDEIVIFPDDETLVIHKVPSPYLVREVKKINDKRSQTVTTRNLGNDRKHRNSVSQSVLSNSDRPSYKNKANSKNNDIMLNNHYNSPRSVNSTSNFKRNTNSCGWNECKMVFNTNEELVQHVCDPNIHLLKDVHESNQYCCLWKGCFSSKRYHTLNRFNDLNKLISHICQVHLNYYNRLPDTEIFLNLNNYSLMDNSLINGSSNLLDKNHQEQQPNHIITSGTTNLHISDTQIGYSSHNFNNKNLMEFNNMLLSYLTNMGQAVQQLNSHIGVLNTQVVNLTSIIHEQSQELKQLKQIDRNHKCCSHIPISNWQSTDRSSCLFKESITTNPVDTNRSFSPLVVSPNFLESASADILKFALQQPYNNELNNVENPHELIASPTSLISSNISHENDRKGIDGN